MIRIIQVPALQTHEFDPLPNWDKKHAQTFNRICELVKRIAYKPNVKFKVYQRHYGIGIDLIVYTIDADLKTHESTTTVNHTNMMDYYSFDKITDEEFFEMMRKNIRKMEIHESDEFLMVDGVRMYDQHEEERKQLENEGQ